MVNFTGNTKAFPHVTDMTVSTKHIYFLLKKEQDQESVMVVTDRNVKLDRSK
jgi:hypothetical protein